MREGYQRWPLAQTFDLVCRWLMPTERISQRLNQTSAVFLNRNLNRVYHRRCQTDERLEDTPYPPMSPLFMLEHRQDLKPPFEKASNCVVRLPCRIQSVCYRVQ